MLNKIIFTNSYIEYITMSEQPRDALKDVDIAGEGRLSRSEQQESARKAQRDQKRREARERAIAKAEALRDEEKLRKQNKRQRENMDEDANDRPLKSTKSEASDMAKRLWVEALETARMRGATDTSQQTTSEQKTKDKEIKKLRKQLEKEKQKKKRGKSKRGRGYNSWREAVRIYNATSSEYKIPRKGTPLYNKVKDMANQLQKTYLSAKSSANPQ